ncbi:MAG: hypothetical protein IH945_12440 [Armatimonadetes bacterium]|nr:hypothetical protein [Armatimonadota bacterium]
MVRRLLALTACLAAVAAPVAATADEDSYFGPQVGLFYPTNQTLRNALGDSWFSFGASRVRIFELRESKWANDWQAISKRRMGSSIFILTGSSGYVIPFGTPGSGTQPYLAIRGGLAYIDYAINTPGGRRSAKRIGVNANAAVGINLNRRFNLEARYDVFNGYDSLTFNGLTLSLKFGMARF